MSRLKYNYQKKNAAVSCGGEKTDLQSNNKVGSDRKKVLDTEHAGTG